jgi:FMN phosphatase YigB (HAD superfamily)
MTIRAIVFDLGHTLWDITPQPAALERAYVELRSALVQRLRSTDLPEAPSFQRAMRDVLHEAAKTYANDSLDLREPPPHEWLGQACERLGVAVDAAMLREVAPPLFATEIDGLVVGAGTHEAVAGLARAGYRLGCITNTLADTNTIRAMLRKQGFESMMASVVVSTEEGWRKPHRQLFDRSTRELDVAPDEAVFVGDSPVHDIGGAKSAGLRAILTRQYVERPYPEGVPAPDAVIGHLSELHEVLLGWSD